MKLSRILIVVAIIVLLFFLIRYIVMINYNTLSSLNDAKGSVLIPATSLTSDPNGSSSNNFTYSIWFYISDWTYRYGQNKVIFTRSATGSRSGTFNNAFMRDGAKLGCGYWKPENSNVVRGSGCAIGTALPLHEVRTAYEKINGAGSYIHSPCEDTINGCCPFSEIARTTQHGDNCKLNGASLYPCPTMYLGATENDLFYQLYIPDPKTSGSKILYNIGVKNIPIQRWVHSVLCVYDRTAEVYIDGKLARTVVMPNVMDAISTNGDIYLSPGEPNDDKSEVGFSGYTSNLKYYPNPITPLDVWNLYRAGPGTGVNNGFSGSDYSVEVSLYDGNVKKNGYTIGGNTIIKSTT